MKKNTIIFGFLTISAIALALGIRNHIQANTGLSEESLANIEAMGANDDPPTPGPNPSSKEVGYYRHEGECHFCFCKEFSLKIHKGLGLDENGCGWADGKVACQYGGDFECRTIDCAEIYRIFFSGDSDKPKEPEP